MVVLLKGTQVQVPEEEEAQRAAWEAEHIEPALEFHLDQVA